MPKGEIQVLGKSLIERHINGLKGVGITDIALVTGYKAEMIQYPNLLKFINSNYESTNMIYSLNIAKSFIDDDIVILYSDILLDDSVYDKFKKFEHNIEILVDKNWVSYWRLRFGEKINQDLEGLNVEGTEIISIGMNSDLRIENIDGRFVGVVYISKKKIHLLTDIEINYPNYRTIDFTGYLSFLISKGEKLNAFWIEGGWYEIDTDSDYEIFTDDSLIAVNKLRKIGLNLK